jgi:glutamate N-acetyltransferase/amino-acid N-acetyltransferase
MGSLAKGSGMILPNMATMLCFVTTDCAIEPALLRKPFWRGGCLRQLAFRDGGHLHQRHVAVSHREAGNATIRDRGAEYRSFCSALEEV